MKFYQKSDNISAVSEYSSNIVTVTMLNSMATPQTIADIRRFNRTVLGRTFVKRFDLFHRTVVCLFALFVCLSVYPVWCDVGVLWANIWMDQDKTWHGGRPRARPYCVRWGAISPCKRDPAAPYFRPMSIVAKVLNGSRYHLVRR